MNPCCYIPVVSDRLQSRTTTTSDLVAAGTARRLQSRRDPGCEWPPAGIRSRTDSPGKCVVMTAGLLPMVLSRYSFHGDHAPKKLDESFTLRTIDPGPETDE